MSRFARDVCKCKDCALDETSIVLCEKHSDQLRVIQAERIEWLTKNMMRKMKGLKESA